MGMLEVATKWGTPLPQRSQDCYEWAFKWVEGHHDWTLVHGTLNGAAVAHFDGKYRHAWAIKDNLIYEPIHDRVYEYDFYAPVCRPMAEIEYTYEDAVEQILTTGHYGKWHDPENP